MPLPLKPPTAKFPRATSTPKAPNNGSQSSASTGSGGNSRNTLSSTSTTSSAANRSKAPVRSVTPTKRGALAQQAAAGPTPVSYLPEGVPELDLSPEETLEIMERLANGDFEGGAGWGQFLDPINAKRDAVKKPHPQKPSGHSQGKQNLAGTFASLELNQTRRTTKQGTIPEEVTITNDLEVPEEEGSDYSPPIWMQRLEELIEAVDRYKTHQQRTITALLEAQFEENIPEDRFSRFMKKMEATMTKLDFITKHNFSETTRLFFQSDSPQKKNPNLPVPMEEQEEFLSSMGGLSDTLKKLNGFFANSEEEIDFEGMVDYFNELLVEMDEDLITTESQLKCVEHFSGLMRKYLEKFESEEEDEEDM